jgi:hypothetical protein
MAALLGRVFSGKVSLKAGSYSKVNFLWRSRLCKRAQPSRRIASSTLKLVRIIGSPLLGSDIPNEAYSAALQGFPPPRIRHRRNVFYGGGRFDDTNLK